MQGSLGEKIFEGVFADVHAWAMDARLRFVGRVLPERIITGVLR